MTVRDYLRSGGARSGRRVLVAGLVLATSAASVLIGAPASADSVRDSQWALTMLRIAEANKISQGEGVIVAVVDTGVDGTHPDLTGTVLKGTSILAAGKDGWDDPVPHGTGVASVIAGHGHGNGAGIVGIAPKAKILPVKVYEKPASGALPGLTAINPTDVATGIRYAVDNGAKVVSVALGGPPVNELEQAVQYAWSKGVLVVAGSGNDPGESQAWPAAYPVVIGVSGVDRTGTFDSHATWGPHVRIAAPSVDVANAVPGAGYTTSTGTSLATGYVAGAAALVRSKYPDISVDELRRRVLHSASDKGDPGFDKKLGYGILDPVAALAPTVPNLDPSPAPSAELTPKKPKEYHEAEPNTSEKVIGWLCPVVVVLVIALVIWLVVRSRRRKARRTAPGAGGPPFGPPPVGPQGGPPPGAQQTGPPQDGDGWRRPPGA